MSHETNGNSEGLVTPRLRKPPALLTPHARVLLELSRDPDARLRDLAVRTELTERTVHRIVSELVDSGNVARHRRGRRVSYDLVMRDGLDEVAALARLGAAATDTHDAVASDASAGQDPDARIQHVEEALREAEERFRSLVEHIPAAVYIQDASGKHLYASPQIKAITGYTAAEWIGHPTLWSDVIHPDDRKEHELDGLAALKLRLAALSLAHVDGDLLDLQPGLLQAQQSLDLGGAADVRLGHHQHRLRVHSRHPGGRIVERAAEPQVHRLLKETDPEPARGLGS